MRYYISDLHFGHAKLNTEMDHRGFASAEEMNQHMINQWNSRVRHGDEVVILGDFCMSNVKRRFAIRTGDGLKSPEIRMAATLLQTRDARTPAVTTLCRCLA